MGSAETVAGERDVVGMGTELVVMGAAGADEFDVWTRGIESRCTFFFISCPFVDLVEVLVVEETAGGDAETGVE